MFPRSFQAGSAPQLSGEGLACFRTSSESRASENHCDVKVRLEEDTPTGTVRAEVSCEAVKLNFELYLARTMGNRGFWALWSNDILFCLGIFSEIKLFGVHNNTNEWCLNPLHMTQPTALMSPCSHVFWVCGPLSLEVAHWWEILNSLVILDILVSLIYALHQTMIL